MNTCKHCGQHIVLHNYALGERWVHQPDGAAFSDGVYEYCKVTVAAPSEDGAP